MTMSQQAGLVDARGTWKPYRVCYEIITVSRRREPGATVEVITKNDPGVLHDQRTWCAVTGHELLDTQHHDGEARSLSRLSEPTRSAATMTVIISTAGLEHVVFPLDKAAAGAVLGMSVNVVFEGAGVRLLKRGYRAKLSGVVGGMFTPLVERVMRTQIGWPLPQQTITMLDDLGTSFYVCGPSMHGYGVTEGELIVDHYTIGAVVTWADLLARSDIQVFSKARFEKP